MKRLLLFLLAIVAILPLSAQYKPVVVKQDHNTATVVRRNTSLTVSSRLRIPFWVYIDDVLQNEEPVKSITINQIPLGESFISIVLDDDESHSFGQYVAFDQMALAFVVNQNGPYYGWEPGGGNIVRPEMTMSLVTAEPMLPPTGPYITNDYDFEAIRSTLASESFDNTRLSTAKQIVSSNPLSAAQITEICKLFSFESNRLDFAKYAYPYCVDKNMYFLVNTSFSYDSSKRELDSFLKGQ